MIMKQNMRKMMEALWSDEVIVENIRPSEIKVVKKK